MDHPAFPGTEGAAPPLPCEWLEQKGNKNRISAHCFHLELSCFPRLLGKVEVELQRSRGGRFHPRRVWRFANSCQKFNGTKFSPLPGEQVKPSYFCSSTKTVMIYPSFYLRTEGKTIWTISSRVQNAGNSSRSFTRTDQRCYQLRLHSQTFQVLYF